MGEGELLFGIRYLSGTHDDRFELPLESRFLNASLVWNLGLGICYVSFERIHRMMLLFSKNDDFT